MLDITTRRGDITTTEADAIIVNLFQGVTSPGGATGAVDAATKGAISAALAAGDFKGREGTHLTLYPGDGIGAPRVVVVGLGPSDGFDVEGVRRAAGTAVKALKGTRARRAATIVHGAGIGGLDPDECARNIAGASISMAWSFSRKAEPGASDGGDDGGDGDDDGRSALEELVIVAHDDATLQAVEAGAGRGRIVAEAQCLARNVASWSADEGAAVGIAESVREMAEMYELDCRVLGPEGIAEERMHLVEAVNRGSAREPRYVVLEHRPADPAATVCLVGKGVCFDTGGISIKPSKSMGKMKYDKSGAAAVFGVLQAAARLDLDVHVVGLTPLVENMPGGRAIKPGDVLESRSGRTVEVLNTDAEGRLILADALDHAKEFEPDHTVDLATLTGAVTTALGTQAAAVMGNDDALVDGLVAAGEATHERVWPLPLWAEYGTQIETSTADVKNTGGRPAGCITAGKFLETFAPDSWAHLDIASTAWNDAKPYYNRHYYPSGATGVGVRLLTQWLSDLSDA